MISSHNIDTFFNPSTVAVIGASNKKDSVGNVIFDNLIHGDYKGHTYPVTLSSEEVLGKKAYRSVLDIDGDIDLAVIAIPAPAVNIVVEECVKKGIKSCIIITGGFSEIGENEREEKMKEIISSSDMRVIGPNCVGVYDTYTQLDTIFLPEEKMGRPKKGKIGLISQSGAFVAAMLDWTASVGIGMSKVVSFGNKVDVNYSDLVQYFSKDESTSVIAIYMEGLTNGKRFLRASKEAVMEKPIVALKAGRSSAGAAAAASHTGSLAGVDQIYSGAFTQAGIIRTYSTEELFDVSKVFVDHISPKGNKVAIITNGGGSGVMATDALEDWGLEIAPLQDITKKYLRRELPPHCSVKNPIDLTGDSDIRRYEVAIDAVSNDDAVDMILLILLLQVPTMGEEVVERIWKATRDVKKPLVVVSAGGEYTQEKIRQLESKGFICYQTPERGVRALGALYGHYEYVRKRR